MNDWVKRNSAGQFERQRDIWTLDTWDSGYADNRGRFRVYRPDFPHAYKGGYALRAHVVWWLAHGERHPKETELHHKDHDRLNDRIENLVPLTRSEHQSGHKENWAHLVCERCRKEYKINAWRLTQAPTRRYCTRACYLNGPRPERRKRAL
jgi:hypothetical protein